MGRLLRLSLAQSLLLVALAALAALLLMFATDYWRKRGTGVTSSEPALAVSPDGQTLAMNISHRPLFQRRHPVLLKSTSELQSPARTLESHGWVVSDVAWSPDGKYVVSSSGDRTIRIWNVETGREVKRFDDQELSPSCLAVDPEKRHLIVADDDVAMVLDFESGDLIAKLPGHTSWLTDVAYSADARFAVTTSHKGIRIWDTGTWQEVVRSELPAGLAGVAMTPDNRVILGGYRPAEDGKPWQVLVETRELPSLDVVEAWPVDSYAAISSVAISQDGKYVAGAHGGDEEQAHSAVTVWNAKTGDELATMEVWQHQNYWIEELAFSGDGQTLFCASANGRVTAQHWATGEGELIFSRPGVRWISFLLGAIVWSFAWKYVPRATRKTEAHVEEMAVS